MKWINFKDKQPEEGQLCIIYTNTRIQDVATFQRVPIILENKECTFNNFKLNYPMDYRRILPKDLNAFITHWMPLPEPPNLNS